jgi:hypothetical protein
MRKLGFRSMILDRIEEQLSKLLVKPAEGSDRDDISYKANPNEGYHTPLLSLYRDVIEIRTLTGDPMITGNPMNDLYQKRLATRLPSISILPARGARVENATVTQQSRLELGTTRIFWPIIIRLTLEQGTGAKYEDARRVYSDEGMPIPLTDQWVLAWDDMDVLLNAHTLASVNVRNKSDDARFPVSMLDALVTGCEPMEGLVAPFEILDFELMVILNQDKAPGSKYQTASPPTIAGLQQLP